MIYVIFLLVAAVSIFAVEAFAAKKSVVDMGEKIKLYKKSDEEIVPYSGGKLILMTVICFALSFCVQISLYNNTEIINFIKLYLLFLIVMAAAIVDSKRKIIPNALIIIGLVLRVGIYAYEIYSGADIKAIIINDLIGIGLGFGFLAIASLLTKGSIGFGDAKLFGIIGMFSGSYCTYSTLLVSLILSAIFAFIGIARKKMGRKDSIPFGPFIAIGYTIALLLTSY